jgi:benzoyl-CoA reductase subunit A
MECFIGIDLGSTTTKAIVLDPDGRVIGRGITNSRSNYDIAAEVAREEAFIDVRFDRVARTIAAVLREDAGARERAAHLKAAFERERHLRQLARLEARCRTAAGEGRNAANSAALGEALDRIFDGLRADADALFRPGVTARSDFFRDISGSGFVAAAGQVARAGGPPFERLVALFDRSIIPVENESEDRPFVELLRGALVHLSRGPHRLDREIADRVLDAAEVSIEPRNRVGTGYGRLRLPFPKECIRSEILCHGLGAHLMFPGTRTVLDIGGQDTKAIQVDADGVVTNFQMNDRCAAGCGRYLGYIADEMSIGVHELGPMALLAKRRVKINSTCTVFAGAEFRDRLAAGESREDIVAGLHRAIILRAMSLLARSGGVFEEFTFTGGVARNEAAVRALRELVGENYGQLTLNIAPDSIFTGALGAANFALRDARGAANPGEEVPCSAPQGSMSAQAR